MVTLRVHNASQDEMKSHIEDRGEIVTKESLAKEASKYATASNLKKTLAVTGRQDAQLCIGQEDYCANGKYLMGGKDAVFELKLTGSLWNDALTTNLIDPTHLYSCDEIEMLMAEVKDNSENDKRLASLEADDINFRFYDASTGHLKCETDLIYFGNPSTGEVDTQASRVALYNAEGVRFMVAYVDDPVQPYLPELTWGNFAEDYCKTNTVPVAPADHQQIIAEMQQEMLQEKKAAEGDSNLIAQR